MGFSTERQGPELGRYGHHAGSSDPLATLTCTPDANGYNTGNLLAVNYYEWCQDHNKPMEAKPFGDIGGGGPVTLPQPNLFTNGAWYGGSPYLGPDATVRSPAPRARRLRRARSRTADVGSGLRLHVALA